MEITGLFNLKSHKLFCAVRHEFVARTPEEIVRQQLLDHFFKVGGYPEHLTRVEMPLTFFDSSSAVPKRRVDIVCFYKNQEFLLPLLLVECKAQMPRASTVGQLAGYNFFVKAPFTAVAWKEVIIMYKGTTLIYEGGFKNLPSYEALLSMSRL